MVEWDCIKEDIKVAQVMDHQRMKINVATG